MLRNIIKGSKTLFVFFSDSTQLWKLDHDNKLINKANIWSSDDDFKITPNGLIELIENNSTNKKTVLRINRKNNVVEEKKFVEGKDGQLWKKGEPNDEGYFTLEGSKSRKVMTAVSEDKIKIKGKLVNYCFSYHYNQTSNIRLKNDIKYIFSNFLKSLPKNEWC